MATLSGRFGKSNELKTQFTARDGTYHQVSRPSFDRVVRAPCNSLRTPPIKVSFLKVKGASSSGNHERILFNFGRDLFFYPFPGLDKQVDLTRPLDKRVYKGTYPTCHDFNLMTRSWDSVQLIIGFSTGPIQLMNPIKREVLRLFNEQTLIDHTQVMCIKWIQSTEVQFLAAHRSGYMYLYNGDLPCSSHSPHYAVTKQIGDVVISHNKSKGKNPVCRWAIGKDSINYFDFSPDLKLIAFASQDGVLRVMNYETYQVLGHMKMYFGGLLSLAWSPDGHYIAVGGEMDVLIIWSVADRQPVAQGEAHRSWVSVVQFDCHLYGHSGKRLSIWNEDGSGDEEKEGVAAAESSDELELVKYRLGSVGQDAHLVLWDLFEEDLVPSGAIRTQSQSIKVTHKKHESDLVAEVNHAPEEGGGGEEKAVGGGKAAAVESSDDDNASLVLTASMMNQLNTVSPLLNKRVSQDHVTDLIFREECIVTVSQDGAIRFWARPKYSEQLNVESKAAEEQQSQKQMTLAEQADLSVSGNSRDGSPPGTVV